MTNPRWPYYAPLNPLCGNTQRHCIDPCKDPMRMSENLAYTGPNLPCTGIETCDSLSTAIQKIEESMCSIINSYNCVIAGYAYEY